MAVVKPMPLKMQAIKKYKWRTVEDYGIHLNLKGFDANLDYLALENDGFLVVRKGYAWDGASGPTWDTEAVYRPSMIHDALYQLMRGEFIPQDLRLRVDEIFYEQCLLSGMGKFRAGYYYRGVRWFGWMSTKPSDSNPIIEVP